MDEDRRGHREERDAPVEGEVPQQEVQLRREQRAEEAEEREDTGAARERVRDHRQNGEAHVAKRIDRVADVDPMDVRQGLRIELVVPLTGVVVREIAIASAAGSQRIARSTATSLTPATHGCTTATSTRPSATTLATTNPTSCARSLAARGGTDSPAAKRRRQP